MTGYWAEVSETYHVKILQPDEDQVSTMKQGSNLEETYLVKILKPDDNQVSALKQGSNMEEDWYWMWHGLGGQQVRCRGDHCTALD